MEGEHFLDENCYFGHGFRFYDPENYLRPNMRRQDTFHTGNTDFGFLREVERSTYYNREEPNLDSTPIGLRQECPCIRVRYPISGEEAKCWPI